MKRSIDRAKWIVVGVVITMAMVWLDQQVSPSISHTDVIVISAASYQVGYEQGASAVMQNKYPDAAPEDLAKFLSIYINHERKQQIKRTGDSRSD